MIGRLNCNALPVARLREAISYDPGTGVFIWRVRPLAHFIDGGKPAEHRMAMWNGKYAGQLALTSRDERGYLLGRFDGKNLWAHRAAWVLYHGEWPAAAIDHINRDKGDNRIVNLRLTDHSANARNSAASDRPDRCVYPAQRGHGWRVAIKREGRVVFCRTFPSKAEAIAARDEFERLRDQRPGGARDAEDNLPAMLRRPEKEERSMPERDLHARRGGLDVLALRVDGRVRS